MTGISLPSPAVEYRDLTINPTTGSRWKAGSRFYPLELAWCRSGACRPTGVLGSQCTSDRM